MNEGGLDRVIRVVVGLALVLGTPQLMGYINSNWHGSVWCPC